MKIKIKNQFKTKIKSFKSNNFLKNHVNEEIKHIYDNNYITIYNALKKITGINSSSAYNLLNSSGISPKATFKDLKKKKSFINENFNSNLKITRLLLNNNILGERRKNIAKKIHLMNLQGIRHKNNLPVRGQRTSTNARTRKKFRII